MYHHNVQKSVHIDFEKRKKKEWIALGVYPGRFLPTGKIGQELVPGKGKGKTQRGQETREGGSSHEKQAAKKRKTQMGAQEKF
jgi:hypothetical protein